MSSEPVPDARIDEAREKLEQLDELPVAEHPATYDDVHQKLDDALSDAAGE